MGLGADKIIKKSELLVEPTANEILAIRKEAFVKILAGQYKDLYGQVRRLFSAMLQFCILIIIHSV